ncbi:hypothetical protein K402DRAFT_393654 [Aulographum hederae CBS 113979]|uniref:Membrane insertase YidC/Oxa/ALB C-terminal domain-containing protein n=1 Tax=Aulographum hederae CBS 113979 TaxID=1176131 RepID=A0A6G1H0J6_9PEZI|nr:hypothetical protein K402DRAFT_393654 [Aulographum hederae CBS 113979]
MLPSRGLRPFHHSHILGKALIHPQTRSARQFSSVLPGISNTSPLARPAHTVLLAARAPAWRKSLLYAPAALASASISARFASTTPTTTPPTATQSAQNSPPSEFSSDPETLDYDALLAAKPGDIKEYVGFMNDLGLDFGYGPTSIMQFFLEHIHVYSGFPWWGSLLTFAFLYRAVLFPFYTSAAEQQARQSALQPILGPIAERGKEALKRGDLAARDQVRQEQLAIYKAVGIKPMRMFLPMAVQMVFGFGNIRLLRAMGTLPVPGLVTGGFLWVKDLSVGDPYFLLPVLLVVTSHLTARLGSASGEMPANVNPMLMKIMSYAMPLIMGAISLTMPACLQLVFFTTSFLGSLQAIALRNNSVREFIRISPIIRPPKKLEPISVERAVDEVHDLRGRLTASRAAALARYQPPNAQGTLNVKATQVNKFSSTPHHAPVETESTSSSGEKMSLWEKMTSSAKKNIQSVAKDTREQMNTAMGRSTKTEDSAEESFKMQARRYEERRQREIEEEKLARRLQDGSKAKAKRGRRRQ